MSSSRWLDRLVETARGAACPECGANGAVPLVWGYPHREVEEAAQRGEVALGGCLISELPPPDLRCRSCGRTWWSGPADGN